MDLPNDEIGISDIIAWRDCPRRMSFSMKRWTEEGEPPEATDESNAYGSAIHDVFRLIEVESMTDEQAIQEVFNGELGPHLWPHDLVRMRKDVLTYHERDPMGVRTVGVEVPLRVPLIKIDGKQIFFRGQIDRLYERIDQPGRFIHRDYKSSKWAKTQSEVDSDLQMWAYNWSIHEFWPECEDLVQIYDQLNAGEITTRKSEEARKQIKDWLQRNVVAIATGSDPEDDGLLPPKFNQWCPWCPILESCSIPKQLSQFAKDKIDALSGDAHELPAIEGYVADLEDVSTARKVLDRYEKTVKGLIRELSPDEQEQLGFRTYQRRNAVWSSDAMEAIHELLGPEFFTLASLSQSRVKDYLAGDPRLDSIMALVTREPGAVVVAQKRK